ncbi:glutamate decarboxylase 1-like [Tubulanus polymorphus]|uniref:glutamate decarboxylase 1-like n=1 Tax=Tubulanus polymorphus TaxID=672921 RepID=UPI003DA3F6F3
MSFDMGLLTINDTSVEDQSRKVAQLICGKILENQDTENKKLKVETEEDEKSEPDWSRFESTYARELYPAIDGADTTVEFLTEVVDILIDYIKRVNDRSSKVLDFHHPHQLKEALDHCLEIPETPRDLEQVLSDCKETLKYGVKTGHPRFFNQLSSGLDMIAVAGEWLTATANTNMFTYEIAPVFTLMEEVTLQKMREYIGWQEGDGIFAPGGAISNLYAVHAARHKFFPECKVKGMKAIPRICIFTSEQSHFSLKQAGAVLGFGTESVITVTCDERGKMIPDVLEEKILEAKANNITPFFVSCTAGTTVLGAFDPIKSIAEICERYNLWMHVDCAWGGGVLLSSKHRHVTAGIERADSVTWNPHKMMGATLQCSAVLVKDKNILASCNSMHADYLFQQDKHYDTSYDTGDKAIQCGRHNDVFKLWLMWRAKGESGFESQINRIFDLARYLRDSLRMLEGFELVLDEPEYTNVCFWYIPKFLKGIPQGKLKDDKVNKIAPKIKSMMMEKGTTMVGYQPLGEIPNFFRMVISNPASEKCDIDFLLSEISRLGEEIQPF